MNSVHLVTQEKYRVENQVKKSNQVHKHQNWPSGHSRRAQACLGVRKPSRIVAEALGRIVAQAAVLQRSPARPCAPCRSLLARLARLCRPPAPAPSCRSPMRPARAPAPTPTPSHNTIFCIAAQNPAKLSPSVTIQILYRDTAFPANSLPQSQLYCNMTANPCNTIFPSHNKIWAVAQLNFLHQIFFFQYNYYFFISSSWKNLKNFIFHHFFFHSSCTLNKFIKLYLNHFS